MPRRPEPSEWLCRGLGNPRCLPEWSEARWSGVIAAGRETALLGALWEQARRAGVAERLPPSVVRHLRGAGWAAETQAEALRWELRQLEEGVLQGLSPPVALKGAAYLIAGLPHAAGRVCQDIDLLFPRDSVERAEQLLFFEGWQSGHHSEYDDRYYREWMHELPPLVHGRRGTTLDLHYNILPETFAVRVDPRRLFDRTEPVSGWRTRILAPPHLVLHAVAHLLAETEWEGALRNLYDIHALLVHFEAEVGAPFWADLLEESRELGLARLLEAALVAVQDWFATPVPPSVNAAMAAHRPAWPYRSAWRRLLRTGLRTRADSVPGRRAVAGWLLFLRGHWLKMPPLLLLRHLLYKARQARAETHLPPPVPDAENHG